MWQTVARVSTADSVCAVGARCFVLNKTSGELAELHPGPPAAVPTVAWGWSGVRTITGHNGQLVSVDAAGVLWLHTLSATGVQASSVVAGPVGSVTQLHAPTPNAVYALGRARSRLDIGPTDERTDPPRSSRLLRIDTNTGKAVTVSEQHQDATGFAVTTDEATAYVADAAGRLVETTFGTVQRRVVTTELQTPGSAAWLDEPHGLLLVVETGDALGRGVAVVDVTTGDVRHVPGVSGTPRTVVRLGDLVVLAAKTELLVVAAADIVPDKVVLGVGTEPLYRGGYARVNVDLGTSGHAFDDLDFDIAEGPEFAALSSSRDDTFDPVRPQAMLLAGPVPGSYTLRARTKAGADVAAAAFEVSERWTATDGPPRAFTGANLVHAFGNAWGAISNGTVPFTYNPGLKPIGGVRRVALIIAELPGTVLPPGTQAAFEDALFNGVAGPDGVNRSAVGYFTEMSGGLFTFANAGTANVTLPGTFSDYTEKDGDLWMSKHNLIGDAMWRAQDQVDFLRVDTVAIVVASPNGGVPLAVGGQGSFVWPHASSDTFVLSAPVPVGWGWYWKSFPYLVMPAEWAALSKKTGQPVLDTLCHELGHTIGMKDLYTEPDPTINVGRLDLMSDEGGLPALSMPHRVLLGWVDPSEFRTFNFINENPVNLQFTITASQLVGAAGAAPGEVAGLIIEVAEGRRYYFEYRSFQTGQFADRALPEDRRVIGIEARAGYYAAPVRGAPIALLHDDGDSESPFLEVGEDYEEVDESANASFQLQVVGTTDDNATVNVRYNPPPATLAPPFPNGIDPAIRPWPSAGGEWVSPDIRIENALTPLSTALFPGQPSMPWAGHENTVIATVKNGGSLEAIDVLVEFEVFDFTASGPGSSHRLGFDQANIKPGATHDFQVVWHAPYVYGVLFADTHFCVLARIRPHQQKHPPGAAVTMDIGELNIGNNEAQTNYFRVWSLLGSPYSRVRTPVLVTNPYTDRPVTATLHVEQPLDYFRTYVSPTSMRLSPGETRPVEVMSECLAGIPPYNDIEEEKLYGTPNLVTMITEVSDGTTDAPIPAGAATIEVRVGRRTVFENLDVDRNNASGRIMFADGAPVDTGAVIVASRAVAGVGEVAYDTLVQPDGSFNVATPGFVVAHAAPLKVDLVFPGAIGAAPSEASFDLP